MYRKGENTEGKYVTIDFQTALNLIRYAYDAIEGHDDGQCNAFAEIERILLFSLSERIENNVACHCHEVMSGFAKGNFLISAMLKPLPISIIFLPL